jgi:hypothetical protein
MLVHIYIGLDGRDPGFCSFTYILYTYSDRSRNAQISGHVHYFQWIPRRPAHVSQLEDITLHDCAATTLHHWLHCSCPPGPGCPFPWRCVDTSGLGCFPQRQSSFYCADQPPTSMPFSLASAHCPS